ncbi:hypothetical protein AB0L63_29400 [Nocardia sp. NPDC051990]|uniref:hypothetical protein n=1 Tax=Nocardia sp. NPDC051990 TaxID=3155285 RepID=UPI0034403981
MPRRRTWRRARLGAGIGLIEGPEPPPGQQKPFTDLIWTPDLHHVETAAAVLVAIAQHRFDYTLVDVGALSI